MPDAKKRGDHVESDEESEEEQKIDFTWLVFMGIQMGYTKTEISHMYLGEWNDMFRHYKWLHNLKTKRFVFEERKRVSILDL